MYTTQYTLYKPLFKSYLNRGFLAISLLIVSFKILKK